MTHGIFLPALHVRLDVPDDWTMQKSGSGAFFIASGSTRPILAMTVSSLTALPAGSPVIVAGERGSRVIPGGSIDQVVYVQRGTQILTFTFTPSVGDSLTAPTLFLKILRSMRFEAQSASRGTVMGTGGTLLQGQPCGGAAGILCATGEYCEITDPEANTGFCVKSGH